ncbi:hypothetical protein [Salinispora arenicola]|uniref:hypothetical protein n=1 Tax=Salinispora arenicola TaxID=168697 RepID=UPI0004B0172E|nr:hypothetical protein [Salinispora arenicola]
MTTDADPMSFRMRALSRRRGDRSLLRTPAALLAVPCIVLGHLFLSANPPVAAYAPAGAAAVTGTMSIIAPLLAACAAWEALTLRALWGLLTVDRPWWRVLLGRLAPVLVAGLLVQAVLYADVLLTSSRLGWPGWQFPLLSVLGTVTWTIFGAAIALVLGRLLALTVALLAPYLLLTLPAGWEPLWLRHLNGSPFDCCSTSQVLDPLVTIGAAGVLGAILVVSLCLVRVRLAPVQDRPWVALVTTVAAVVAGVAAASAVTGLGASPARPRPAADLVCHGTVCLWPEDAAARDANVAAWDAARASWARLGLPAPAVDRVGPIQADGMLPLTTTSSDVQAAKATMAQLLPRALSGCLTDFDDAAQGERLDSLTMMLARDLGVDDQLAASLPAGSPAPTPALAQRLWRETGRCPR